MADCSPCRVVLCWRYPPGPSCLLAFILFLALAPCCLSGGTLLLTSIFFHSPYCASFARPPLWSLELFLLSLQMVPPSFLPIYSHSALALFSSPHSLSLPRDRSLPPPSLFENEIFASASDLVLLNSLSSSAPWPVPATLKDARQMFGECSVSFLLGTHT